MPVLFAKFEDLVCQCAGGKKGGGLKMEEANACEQSFKMIIAEGDPAVLYFHGLKKAVAIAKSPVIGADDGRGHGEEFPVEVDGIRRCKFAAAQFIVAR
jgi:hypothetical protein